MCSATRRSMGGSVSSDPLCRERPSRPASLFEMLELDTDHVSRPAVSVVSPAARRTPPRVFCNSGIKNLRISPPGRHKDHRSRGPSVTRALLFRLDVMATDPRILGFVNQWFSLAFDTATRVRLSSGREIRVITAPCFLGTKLEAFKSRGGGDYQGSKDIDSPARCDPRPGVHRRGGLIRADGAARLPVDSHSAAAR